MARRIIDRLPYVRSTGEGGPGPSALVRSGSAPGSPDHPRDDLVGDTWDNYGNVTGKNELGDHRLAAILGCQHFGDDTVEQFAALVGEEVDTDHLTGRGSDLDYDSDVANAYLKHMTEDQTMQAILQFAHGEDGVATVVETWSDTATKIVKKARSLGREFTSADFDQRSKSRVDKSAAFLTSSSTLDTSSEPKAVLVSRMSTSRWATRALGRCRFPIGTRRSPIPIYPDVPRLILIIQGMSGCSRMTVAARTARAPPLQGRERCPDHPTNADRRRQ
jgi:hypothetical protein